MEATTVGYIGFRVGVKEWKRTSKLLQRGSIGFRV